MIRRESPIGCMLIRQVDHAVLSSSLARQIGHGAFESLRDDELTGIASHDDGWHLHDDRPTLNGRSVPADVFETAPSTALTIWSESTRLACAKSALAGLLTSLHGLSLSSTFSVPNPIGRAFDAGDARLRYELNRFQHDQIEIQERLRGDLDMATGRPLKLGMEEPPGDESEKRLTFAFRWLQAMDKLSLNLCFNRLVFPRLEPVHASPESAATSITCRQIDKTRWTISPWVFKADSFTVASTAITLDQQIFASDDDLRNAVAVASREQLEWHFAR